LDLYQGVFSCILMTEHLYYGKIYHLTHNFKKMTKTIFQCARLRFKLAAEAGLSPAEGVAIQIITENEEKIIFEDSAIGGGNPINRIRAEIDNYNLLSQTFMIEAIVVATELDAVKGDTVDPSPETMRFLEDLVRNQENDHLERPSIFVVYGHADNDDHIREIHLAP